MEPAFRQGSLCLSGSGVLRVNSEDQFAHSGHRFVMIDNRQCLQPLPPPPPPPAAAVAAENKRSSQSTPRQNTHASFSSIATHASLPNPNIELGGDGCGAAAGEMWPSTVEQWLHRDPELPLRARERRGRCKHEQCYDCGEGDEDEDEDDEDEEAEPHQQCHYHSNARCRNLRCRNSRCRQHTIERRRHRGAQNSCLHCAHCGAHSDPNVCERCTANDSAALSHCGTCNTRTLAHGLENVSVSNSSPGASTSAAANAGANANSASARELYQQLSLSADQQQQQQQLQSLQNSQQCLFQFPANYMAAPQSAQLPVQATYYPSIGGTANGLPYATAGAQNALYSSGSVYASFGTDASQVPVLLSAAQQQQMQQQLLQQQQTFYLADACAQGAQPVLYSTQDAQNSLYASAGVVPVVQQGVQPQIYYTSSGQPLVFVPLPNAQVAPLASGRAPAAQLAAAVLPILPTAAAEAAPVAGVASAAGAALAAAAGASSSSNETFEPLSSEQRILLENVLSSTTQTAAAAPAGDVGGSGGGGRARGLGAAADSANPNANPGAQMPKPLPPERTLSPQPVAANQAVASNPNVTPKPSAGKANVAAGEAPSTPKDTAPKTSASNAEQPLPEVSQLQFSPYAEEAVGSITSDFSEVPEHCARSADRYGRGHFVPSIDPRVSGSWGDQHTRIGADRIESDRLDSTRERRQRCAPAIRVGRARFRPQPDIGARLITLEVRLARENAKGARSELVVGCVCPVLCSLCAGR